jgi:hypothetical protein
MDPSLVDKAMGLCLKEEGRDDWIRVDSKSSSNLNAKYRTEGGFLTTKEQLDFSQSMSEMSDFLMNDEVNLPQAYPEWCPRGYTIQSFDANVKLIQLFVETKFLLTKMQHCVVLAVARTTLPSGAQLILERSIDLPEDLLVESSGGRLRSSVCQVGMRGYLVEAKGEGSSVTRFSYLRPGPSMIRETALLKAIQKATAEILPRLQKFKE